MVPQTRYARAGDVTVAFSVHGEGPDVLFTTGLISHVEHAWEEPNLARFLTRLAGSCRLIMVDRRGTGLSDPAPAGGELEAEVADVDAVLDAVGSERAALVGYTSGGTLLVRYAVDRPERVSALVLYACVVRNAAGPGLEWVRAPEERARDFAEQVEHWGEGRLVEQVAPSRAGDPRLRAWFARLERLSASPGQLAASVRATTEVDVSGLLPRVRAPTLVLHRTGDTLIDVRHSRYTAAHVPGARLVELDGVDSMPSEGDADALLDAIEDFVGAARGAREPERALRTVLFSDIVDSTGRAFGLGDRAWRDLLAAHDAAVRRELERFGGVEVKTTGDGFLATFAGAPSHAVRCARAVVAAASELGLDVRAGLHLGECELVGADVAGLAVHVAARVNGLAGAGEVLVSSTLREAVAGSGLAWDARGERELRGVPGRWRTYALADRARAQA